MGSASLTHAADLADPHSTSCERAKRSSLRGMDGLLRCARNDGEMATQSASPRRRGSSTPRPISSIIDVSGILDHPPARVMTTEHALAAMGFASLYPSYDRPARSSRRLTVLARVRLGDGRPRHCTMPAIAQRIDQQRENGRPLMARRVRQVVVRQPPARYVLVVVAEFRREREEGAAEIRMMEWVSWWASHRSSTLCRRRASSLR